MMTPIEIALTICLGAALLWALWLLHVLSEAKYHAKWIDVTWRDMHKQRDDACRDLDAFKLAAKKEQAALAAKIEAAKLALDGELKATQPAIARSIA